MLSDFNKQEHFTDDKILNILLFKLYFNKIKISGAITGRNIKSTSILNLKSQNNHDFVLFFKEH